MEYSAVVFDSVMAFNVQNHFLSRSFQKCEFKHYRKFRETFSNNNLQQCTIYSVYMDSVCLFESKF